MPQLNEKLIRVGDAQARYLGGQMSVEWWRRQVHLGNLPHFRAGLVILLRPADIEAFVAQLFRAARVKRGGVS